VGVSTTTIAANVYKRQRCREHRPELKLLQTWLLDEKVVFLLLESMAESLKFMFAGRGT
jgi:hypothetical protein